MNHNPTFLLMLCLIAACLVVGTVSGATELRAPAGTLEPGQTGTFSVVVAGLANAEGIAFNLTFDPTLVSVTGVAANSSAIAGSSVTPNIDNTNGWVAVALTNTNGITATTATPLVDITITAKAPGGVTKIGVARAEYSLAFVPHEFEMLGEGSIDAGTAVAGTPVSTDSGNPASITSTATQTQSPGTTIAAPSLQVSVDDQAPSSTPVATLTTEVTTNATVSSTETEMQTGAPAPASAPVQYVPVLAVLVGLLVGFRRR